MIAARPAVGRPAGGTRRPGLLAGVVLAPAGATGLLTFTAAFGDLTLFETAVPVARGRQYDSGTTPPTGVDAVLPAAATCRWAGQTVALGNRLPWAKRSSLLERRLTMKNRLTGNGGLGEDVGMPRPERVLKDSDGPVERFAAALRELREEAGRPGYRELARRAHYSVTTLSVAAAGRQLPSLAVALAYAEACGGDRATWEKRWRAAAAELAGSEMTGTVTTEPVSRAVPETAASAVSERAEHAVAGAAEPAVTEAADVDADTLTSAGPETAGGGAGALTESAETVYAALTPAQQRTARQVLLRLLDIGEDAFVTRRRVRRARFDHDDREVSTVIDQFAAARLLTVTRDTVEITHEALVQAWPRLRGWVDDEREGLRVHRLLTAAATDWESLGRDDSALYRGIPLTRARNWMAERPGAVTARERDFLDRGLSVQDRVQANRRRLRRTVLAGLLAAVVTVGSFAVSEWITDGSTARTSNACGPTRSKDDGCGDALARSFADGRADLIVHSGTDVSVRLNTGTGFDGGRSITAGWEQFHGRENAGHLGRLYFADYNGDGRADLIVHLGTDLSVRLNTGTGFDGGRSVSSGWGRFHGRENENGLGRLYFADYNGDRLADLIVHLGTDLSVRLNTGTGFDGGRSVSSGWGQFHGRENAGHLGRLYFADYNGDRRADLIVHSGSDLSVRLNTGTGFDGGRSVSSGWGLFHGKENSNHLGRLYFA